MPNPEPEWTLADEMGGIEPLHSVVEAFYDRVFDDPLIGFLFREVDRQRIIDLQVEYLRARLGAGDVEYTGEPIRSAHEDLPLTVGHFDRRHTILKEVLEEQEVPAHVREAWIDLDAALRDLVVRTGGEAREAMLDDESEET